MIGRIRPQRTPAAREALLEQSREGSAEVEVERIHLAIRLVEVPPRTFGGRAVDQVHRSGPLGLAGPQRAFILDEQGVFVAGRPHRRRRPLARLSERGGDLNLCRRRSRARAQAQRRQCCDYRHQAARWHPVQIGQHVRPPGLSLG